MNSQNNMVQKILAKNSSLTELDDFFRQELKDAGYSSVDVIKTPIGTSLNVFVNKPGLVIGRRGSGIQNLTITIEKRFKLPNPQISVTEVKVPELNAHIMASKLSQTISRGSPIRRAANWATRSIMQAGARGVEITVSGKMRSDRARREKYKAGVVPKSGFTASQSVVFASVESLLKVGLIGIKVSIALPQKNDSDFILNKSITEDNTEKSSAVESTDKPAQSTDKPAQSTDKPAQSTDKYKKED